MIYYNDLNDSQKLAVTALDNHIRVVAGAGSGKTRVLTMRIVYLIQELGINPKGILAITFTNKAAKEMKHRIDEMLGDVSAATSISTIHSLCVRILHEDIDRLGYPKNFTIVDADDQQSILKEAYKKYEIDKKEISYGEMLDYIANNKYESINPQEALKQTYGETRLEKKANVYIYYENRLKEIYGLDFDHLILKTILLFKTDERIFSKWSRRYEYIHVDEFQDVDKAQYELIRMLSAYHNHLYVVGDPDQTIYTWRGADVNIIVNFDRDFKDAKTIILNQNYRSTNNILNAANSIIKNNKARVEKELYSLKGDGDKIKHRVLPTADAEAAFVRNQIKKAYNDGLKYHEIAVLYRSNYLSRELEKFLIEDRIPYVITGGIRFYERKEVKDILSYLRLITNENDLAFKRVINEPKRGIGEKTIEAIFEIAKEKDITMYEVCKQGLYPKNAETLTSFVNMIESFKEELTSTSLENLLNDVLNKTGYRSMLEKENETERLENVKALIDDIKEHQETYPDDSLDDYLQMISLYIDRANEKSEDAVNLMTIHSAKGLEFDTVFVIGVSEGVFPSSRSVQDGPKGLEEERRLAYVAYTRAKSHLYITENTDFSYVTGSSKTTSRFVKEIDERYIEDMKEVSKISSTGYSIFDTSIKKDRVEAYPQDAIKVGDKVVHKIFGEGVVVANDGSIMTIAFDYPTGIKKIAAGHPSISKAKELINWWKKYY